MAPMREAVQQLAHSPVFVDESGRRRAWVMWTLGLGGALCLGYVLLLGFSLAGGPINPGDLLPLPGLRQSGEQAAVPKPSSPTVEGSPHRASRHRCRRVIRGPVRRCPDGWGRGWADDHTNGLRGGRGPRTHPAWQPAVHRIAGSSYVTGSPHVAGSVRAVAGSFHIAGALHAVAGHSLPSSLASRRRHHSAWPFRRRVWLRR